MASAGRAYAALFGAQFRAQSAYRLSFAIELFSNLWATVFDIVTVLVMFRVTRSLGGFDLRESLVIAGLAACAFALADLTFGNVDRVRELVRSGLFDTVLLRPLPALPQLIAMDLPLRKLGRVAFGLGVYAAALSANDLTWTPGRVALAVLAPLSGAAYFAAIFTATSVVSFWWVDSGELANSITYGGRDFTTYPVTVYSGLFRRMFAYAIGFAFVAYYPALTLLGRADPLGLPAWLGWASPPVAAAAVAAAAVAWRAGIRHYRSTGS